MIIGEGEKMPAAITQPHFEFVDEWAKRKGIDFNNSHEILISKKRVIKRLQKEINNANKDFGSWEQIKAFELTSDVWSIENGLLTPTMKMKRKNIKEKYLDLYHKIYK